MTGRGRRSLKPPDAVDQLTGTDAELTTEEAVNDGIDAGVGQSEPLGQRNDHLLEDVELQAVVDKG